MISKIDSNRSSSNPYFGRAYSGKTLLTAEDEIAKLIQYSKKVLAGDIAATKWNTEEKFYKTNINEEISMETPSYYALKKIKIKQPDAEDFLFTKRHDDKPEVKKEFQRLADLLYLETKKLFKPIVPEKQTWLDKLLDGKNKV